MIALSEMPFFASTLFRWMGKYRSHFLNTNIKWSLGLSRRILIFIQFSLPFFQQLSAHTVCLSLTFFTIPLPKQSFLALNFLYLMNSSEPFFKTGGISIKEFVLNARVKQISHLRLVSPYVRKILLQINKFRSVLFARLYQHKGDLNTRKPTLKF